MAAMSVFEIAGVFQFSAKTHLFIRFIIGASDMYRLNIIIVIVTNAQIGSIYSGLGTRNRRVMFRFSCANWFRKNDDDRLAFVCTQVPLLKVHRSTDFIKIA